MLAVTCSSKELAQGPDVVKGGAETGVPAQAPLGRFGVGLAKRLGMTAGLVLENHNASVA